MNLREVTHTTEIDASAAEVFGWLRDVGRWPTVFPPTIHAEVLEAGEREETIRLWATANGTPKTWTSRRAIDPEGLTIEFRQERTAHPVGEMVGRWSVEAISPHRARVRLYHGFRPREDVAEQWSVIESAVERNSTAELDALRVAAETASSTPARLFTFVDTIEVDGSARLAFEFLDRGDLWGERLDHVPAVELETYDGGLQRLAMTTRTPDGAEHVTESFRVSFPERGVLYYKQTTLPPLLALHTGVWRVQEADGWLTVSSEHTVAIEEELLAEVLGASASVTDAQALARANLGANSRLTLGRLADFATHGSTVA